MDSAESASPAGVASKNAPRGSVTILLAEDETGVRELISTYLPGLGYNVLTAANGVSGVAAARS